MDIVSCSWSLQGQVLPVGSVMGCSELTERLGGVSRYTRGWHTVLPKNDGPHGPGMCSPNTSPMVAPGEGQKAAL